MRLGVLVGMFPYLVSRGHPPALFNELGGALIDFGASGRDVVLKKKKKVSVTEEVQKRVEGEKKKKMGERAENTYNSEFIKRPRLLNIPQRLVQILEFDIDLLLRVFRGFDSLGLERLDGLDLARDVVFLWLERGKLALDFVDDGRVLERRAVLGEVDGLGLLLQLLQLAAGVVVALFEGLKGGRGAAF